MIPSFVCESCGRDTTHTIPDFWDGGPEGGVIESRQMMRRMLRAREDIERLARAGLDWVTFAVEATEKLREAIPFDRSCWHMVDPGTVLFTGSLNQNVGCSGGWLAQHEYVVEDVNRWSFLAMGTARRRDQPGNTRRMPGPLTPSGG